MVFTPDGAWRRFRVFGSGTVYVVSSPSGSSRTVEVSTSNSRNYCPPEGNDYKTRRNGQYVYLAGCAAGAGKVELRSSRYGQALKAYDITVRSATSSAPTATRTPVPTAPPQPTATQPSAGSASLSPDPSSLNFQPNGNWHRFTLSSTAGSVKVIANPGSKPRRVEVHTSHPGRTYCPAEQNDDKMTSNGNYVYLAGCVSGTGTIELRRASNNALLRTYTFDIGSTTTTNPTPTKTPLPNCSPVQSGTLTSDGTGNEITKSGSWASGCQLVTPGIDAGYTHHYSFRLTRPTHVEMELTGGSNVRLRRGSATSGSTIDDHDLRAQKYSAEIRQSGYYTAVIINPSNTGNFTLKIKGRIPWLGHQKDNKVKYRVGTIQSTRTPQPTSATPNPVPDPAVIIPTAIPTAVKAWNRAVATPAPNVLFERASNEEVIINMARGGTSIVPGHDHRRDPWLVLDEPHCGKTYACVKPKNLSIFPAQWTAAVYNWLIPILSDHMPEMVMALEEPAWSFRKTGVLTGNFTRHFWTKDASRHGSPVSTSDLADIPGIDNSKTYLWAHAPGVIMHEFGHTAGLTDLYNYTGYGIDRLMHTNYGVDAIPTKDREYMRQVYKDGHTH